MIWRFRHALCSEQTERREKRAVNLVAASLVVLAIYIAYESIRKLYLGEAPSESLLGIVIAILSLAVMPALFVLRWRVAARIKSRSLRADAIQTLACNLMTVALLLGLGLHYMTGWWHADPIAALVIAAFLSREGYHAVVEKELCGSS